MDLSGFNADDFPASDDYSALPAGTYTAAIVASESKQTKSRTGSYLELTLEVVDGQYKGRKMEEAEVLDLFEKPQSPYTRALLSALPEHATGDRLPTVSDFFDKEAV